MLSSEIICASIQKQQLFAVRLLTDILYDAYRTVL